MRRDQEFHLGHIGDSVNIQMEVSIYLLYISKLDIEFRGEVWVGAQRRPIAIGMNRQKWNLRARPHRTCDLELKKERCVLAR